LKKGRGASYSDKKGGKREEKERKKRHVNWWEGTKKWFNPVDLFGRLNGRGEKERSWKKKLSKKFFNIEKESKKKKRYDETRGPTKGGDNWEGET